ncbi:MAG: BatD family protein [Muribaculaceae bacterium]|nr:BatD family protein [Muribaculaceae bacterium]
MMNISRFRLYATLLLLTLVGSLTVAAQQPQFALVPPRSVVEGRNFNLTFRLTDGEGNAPSAPQLPHCRLLYGPSTSTMQSTQIVNGRMSSTYSIDYTFVYRAEEAGEVVVPEVSISSGGKALRSRSATFNILPSDNPQGAGGAAAGGQGGRNVHADDHSTQTPGAVGKDDLLVRVSFSKSKVYEQEPVVATIKVYTKYDISSFMVTTQPAFEGFLCEELPVNLEMNLEHYNGQNYHTAVLKRLLLYPQKPGKLSVNSGKYEVTIVQYESVNMGFFRTQRPVEKKLNTSSNAASLTVEALPEPRPAGFNGAVGTFTASAILSPELLKTNEAATYSYTVKGTGNIKFLNTPQMEFPAGIDVYTPKTEIDAHVAGANMSGTHTTVYTIVPQEQGAFSISGVPFVYFDPDKHEYRTIDIQDINIKVARGAATSSAVPEQKALNTEINDILHIHALKGGEHKAPAYVVSSLWYWLAYAVLLLGLVSVVLIYRRNIRLNADVAGRKLARAGRVASKRLKEARGYMQRHEGEKFYEALSQALRGYVGDKFGIAPSQLVRDNIASRLEERGVGEGTVKEVLDVLDTCEMARFTPMGSDTEMSAMYNKAVEAIRSIEK